MCVCVERNSVCEKICTRKDLYVCKGLCVCVCVQAFVLMCVSVCSAHAGCVYQLVNEGEGRGRGGGAKGKEEDEGMRGIMKKGVRKKKETPGTRWKEQESGRRRNGKKPNREKNKW